MNKIIALLAILCFAINYGQQEVAGTVRQRIELNSSFKPFYPLQVKTGGIIPSAILREATFATLDSAQLKEITGTSPENIRLTMPYKEEEIKMLLYRVELLAEGFHVDTDKSTAVAFKRGVHYRGIIEGDTASLVSLNFFEGEMNGVISAAQYNNLIIGKLHRTDNVSDYIVYSDSKLNIPNNFICSAAEPSLKGNSNRNAHDSNDANSTRCVTAYF